LALFCEWNQICWFSSKINRRRREQESLEREDEWEKKRN
jgi:hypothetical protein